MKEVVADVCSNFSDGGLPADLLLKRYFQTRRYAGGGDRRFVRDMVFNIIRSYGLLCASLMAAKVEHAEGEGCEEGLGTMGGAAGVTPRQLLLAYLQLFEPGMLEHLTSSDPHGLEGLSSFEEEWLKRLDVATAKAAAPHLASEVPDWAVAEFERRFHASWQAEAEALSTRAYLNVRLNPQLSDAARADAVAALEADGFRAADYSPYGFTHSENIRLDTHPLYQSGKVEIQDEAAQIASLLVGATKGSKVIDLCAGAGGKTVFVGGLIGASKKAPIYAFDVDARRLEEASKRCKRAGVAVNTQVLNPLGDSRRVEALKQHAGTADVVLVDVPCTGSGTWRRSPDLRWRQSRQSLAALTALQCQLLSEAACLVKPGGRLVYMTCSLFMCENEDVTARFLREQAGMWQQLSVSDLMAASELKLGEGSHAAFLASADGLSLSLSPLKHGTDGFFTAILERTS